jgi:GAF domain-containing protein
VTDQQTIDPLEAFAELARIELASMDFFDVLGRVTQLAKQTVPGAAEVSISLLEEGDPMTAAFTGELALRLDEKQYENGDGPCLAAARGNKTFLVPDMRTEDRWPEFAARAVEHGAGSSVSVPLPIQQFMTGALNVYGREVEAFDTDSIQLAETFASYAAVAVANAHLYQTTAAVAAQLHGAMQSRAVIEQAKGIVAAQRHCPTEAAFAIMSKESQDTNRKLRDIAVDIVNAATGPSTP